MIKMVHTEQFNGLGCDTGTPLFKFYFAAIGMAICYIRPLHTLFLITHKQYQSAYFPALYADY